MGRLSPYKVYCLPAGFSGCAWWRYRLPIAKLAKFGSGAVEVTIADNAGKVAVMEMDRHARAADLLSLQSPGCDDAVLLMRIYKAMGKKVVVDYDDMSFDLSPTNPRYADLGIRECELADGKGGFIYRWRDGENGFDLANNLKRYHAFLEAVRLADLVTVTTDYLARKFAAINPRVAVVPNAIDLARWRKIPRMTERAVEVRVGWCGGDSHVADIEIIAKVLSDIAARNPKLKIVMQCSPFQDWLRLFATVNPKQLEWYPWSQLKDYPLMLASRDYDIGLCPLADVEFNRCKSDIKWQEFTAIGAAVVAQDGLPYAASIRPGRTGLLAGTIKEWEEAIEVLVNDVELRRAMAAEAMDDVKKNHDLETGCLAWERAFIGCIEGTVPPMNGNGMPATEAAACLTA